MDAQPPRQQSNNKHQGVKDSNNLKQISHETKLSLESLELGYEKMPLNLGLSARQWFHEKLHNMVVAED